MLRKETSAEREETQHEMMWRLFIYFIPCSYLSQQQATGPISHGRGHNSESTKMRDRKRKSKQRNPKSRAWKKTDEGIKLVRGLKTDESPITSLKN